MDKSDLKKTHRELQTLLMFTLASAVGMFGFLLSSFGGEGGKINHYVGSVFLGISFSSIVLGLGYAIYVVLSALVRKIFL